MLNSNTIPPEVTQAVAGLGASFGLDANLEFESAGQGVYQLKSTGKQGVKFFWGNEYNTKATELLIEEKKKNNDFSPTVPVYEKVLMVEIHSPGEKMPFVGRADPSHKRDYFSQLQRFMKGEDQEAGTPIEKAEFLIGPEAMDLRLIGVKTIEQLAAAGDVVCQSLPRGYNLKEHAKMWMSINNDQAMAGATKKLSAELSSAQSTIEQLKKENAKRDEETAELMKMVQSLQAQSFNPTTVLDGGEDATGKGKGRARNTNV